MFNVNFNTLVDSNSLYKQPHNVCTNIILFKIFESLINCNVKSLFMDYI